MTNRKELLAAREAALKELKRTDVLYHKTSAAFDAAGEKRDMAEGVFDAASDEWDQAETAWSMAVKELAEYDGNHAEEFV